MIKFLLKTVTAKMSHIKMGMAYQFLSLVYLLACSSRIWIQNIKIKRLIKSMKILKVNIVTIFEKRANLS